MDNQPRKVQVIAQSYYSRKDIQSVMFDFCKNREVVPRYLEGFGKRPDCFDYPNDIFNYAKRGATSFHCSEEIWDDPMNIKSEENVVDRNKNRTGWDFLIDIDSKFFDYAKIAAKLFLDVLEYHGVKHVGIKFSGSKGFHMIIPSKAFPEEINGVKTKDMFPDWPRVVASYLLSSIKEKMNQQIRAMTSREELEKKGEIKKEILCPKCGNPTLRKKIGIYKCTDKKCNCIIESMKSRRKEMICPSCNGKMLRIGEEEIDYCENCKINTAKLNTHDMVDGVPVNYSRKIIEEDSKRNDFLFSSGVKFEKKYSQFNVVEKIDSIEKAIDIVLVSSRHLFRAPYSLHEKTALASVVLTREELNDFTLSDADPLKITETRNFLPDCESGEATQLLLDALEKYEVKEKPEELKTFDKQNTINLQGLDITEDMYPPEIKNVLKGMPSDGRKRGLYLLLSFFSSLELPKDYIIGTINEWNKKNYSPLPQAYVNAQITWFSQKKQMPPNYDKPFYKDFGVYSPPEPGIKNPINYTIKRAIKEKNRKSFKLKQ